MNASPPPRSALMARVPLKLRLGIAGGVATLVAWQLAGLVWQQSISQPTRIARELARLAQTKGLLSMVGSTLYSLAVSAVVATALGVSIGLLVGRSRIARIVIMPYVTAIYSVPFVAFVPVFVVWFGIGRSFVVIAAVAAGAIVLVIPTAAGVREALQRYGELGRSLCVGEFRFFVRVLLPGALPYVITGIRLTVERSLITIIVAEFLVGFTGLGLMLSDARAALDADQVFAVAVATAILGVGLTLILTAVERRAKWE